MKVTNSKIQDVLIVEPKVFSDSRGSFFETFRLDKLNNFLDYQIKFCQENESFSKKNVLRGLHYQLPPKAQSKLVRVIEGEVLDVVVDLRKNSQTFAKHEVFLLSKENKRQLFIPRGFAHGFLTLSDYAIFSYKVDNYYDSELERGIIYNDPQINIEWTINSSDIIVSQKDLELSPIKNNPDLFELKNLYEK